MKGYGNVMLSNKYGECRYEAASILYYIEFAIYMYNKSYVKRGVKRVPEEISTMKYLPIGFNELYWNLIKAASIQEVKESSTMLMKSLKDFEKEMKDKVISKKVISQADIIGTYEEIYSNWKNKMYHAAEKGDTYLSLMTAASCQQFYDEMYSKYDIVRTDLMKNITPDNLVLSAKEFDNSMEEYKKNYETLGMEIKCYKNLDEFEKMYLGGIL